MSAALQQNPQFQIKLSVVRGPHAGQVFQLNKEKISMGRGPENDIVLMDDPQVSRLHAQLVLINRDVEIVKVSVKNAVLVDGENVDRWKLVNGSSFTIGDTEIKIDYDFGQAAEATPQKKLGQIISLKPNEATQVFNPADLVPAVKVPPPPASTKTSPLVKTRPQAVAPRPTPAPNLQLQIQQDVRIAQHQVRTAQQDVRTTQPVESASIFDHPQFRFYMIATIVLGGLLFYFLMPGKANRAAQAKPVLKYEDEINIKLNSTPEKEKVLSREAKQVDRNSPQYLRAQENLMKGMRDYGLGNYLRAQEFFQVVLNLDSDNALARRHLYLSRVRFEELVQSKLMLGESYFNKHNFDMCLSMYQQVMNMLGDKISDPKYKLSERKAKECQLASEGIR